MYDDAPALLCVDLTLDDLVHSSLVAAKFAAPMSKRALYREPVRLEMNLRIRIPESWGPTLHDRAARKTRRVLPDEEINVRDVLNVVVPGLLGTVIDREERITTVQVRKLYEAYLTPGASVAVWRDT